MRFRKDKGVDDYEKMINKICPRCNTKYPYGSQCPKGCYANRKEDNKVYDKYQRQNKDLYKSKEWIRLTEQCKNRFNGLDVYQLYKYNRIVPGELSHHIETVEDNDKRKFDIENLIYLSRESHDEIHTEYRQSVEQKEAMQTFLFECVLRHVRGL